MDDLTRTQRIIEKFFESDKPIEMGLLILNLVITVGIGLLVIKIILHFTRRALKRSSLDAVLYKFIVNAVKAVCLIVLATMCLGILGVQMSTIVAVLGAAGAAIALALKDSLANIAGGVMIIITKPFIRDDYIDIGDVSGKVKDIDLFLTTLRTYDNKTITVPNGLVNTSILVNHSREDMRRVDCQFGISYETDLTKAKDLMRGICRDSELILDEPEATIGVSKLDDSSVLMDMLAWCRTDDYWEVKYFLEEEVKKVFDENGIDMPYPQMEVRLQR